MSEEVGVVRQVFGGSEIERGAETAATAVAAQAKAMIESRYVMAMRNPRNMDQVRQDLLKECRRPSFAHNKSALYNKPIGKGVEGLGIRFVEVAIRCMKNIMAESMMVYADDKREIHRVIVTDLESNSTWPMDINVSKTVERSKPMDDGSYIAVRLNSYKKPVYTVPATDDDLLNKRLSLISKAIRTLGLRLIPGDLQDEAEDIIRAIRLDEAAKDPDAERRAIADGFARLNIKATDLVEYLGHELDACTPPELVSLRGLWGALNDGQATWKEIMDNAREQRGEGGKAPDLGAKGGTTPVSNAAAELLKKIKPEPETANEPPTEKATKKKAAPPSDDRTAQLVALSTKARDAFLKSNGGEIVKANKALADLTEGACKDFNKLSLFLADSEDGGRWESVIEEAIGGDE